MLLRLRRSTRRCSRRAAGIWSSSPRSRARLLPSPRSSVYNATKFGLRGFALGLRADLSSRGIGVSIVSPGFVRDAGMFADSGAKAPPGMGTASPDQVGAAVVKAIEADRVEIAVAPLHQRFMAHFGMVSPSIAVRAQRARAGQKSGGHGRCRAFEDGQEVDDDFGGQKMSSRFLWRPFDPRGERARIRGLPARRAGKRRFDVARLPYSVKVLLENVLRLEDGAPSPPPTSRRSRAGTRQPSRASRSPSSPPGS